MKIRLYQDSRDFDSYKRFGSADLTAFSTTTDFDDPNIPEHIQPVGDVECGAFSCEYIASNKTKKEYDIQELFNRVPHTSLGVVPNDIFKEVIKNGLLVKGTNTYEKPFNSFWRADTDPSYDKFDSARSAMIQVESPMILYTNWYSEWTGLTPDSLMPLPKKSVSGHMYVSTGWVIPVSINGVLVFKIEWWGGQKNYMSREVFNYVVSQWGCGSVVFSDAEQDEKRKKTLLEKIKDLCVNVVLLLKQLIAQKQTIQSTTPPVNSPYNAPQSLKIDEKQVNTGSLLWNNKENSRHSVRVICDEEGLAVQDKNDLCATIGAESEWNPKAVGKKNFDGTRDYGIVQVNTRYWIGEGKLFPSTDYVLNHPAECVRWMCKEWKKGNKNWWYGWSNGSYKKYL